MAKSLEKPLRTKALSENSRIEVLFTLVDQAVVDFIGHNIRREAGDFFFIRRSDKRLPVGFDGELIKIALVFSVNRSAMAVGRYWKPSSSYTGTKTGSPSTKRIKFG